jgi:hypothetical protein
MGEDQGEQGQITKRRDHLNGKEEGGEENRIPAAEAELGLLSQLEHGYQLETDSLGGNPVLRRLKDNEVLRPADANASTVKALEQRGLIRPGKARDPLTIAWRLKKEGK